MFSYLDKKLITYAFVDVRGYHESRNIPGDYTAKEAAADVIALADNLGWNRFHLVGHSMAGMIVQRVAVDAGKRIKSLVALTPVPASGIKLDRKMFDGFVGLVSNRDAVAGYLGSVLDMYTKRYAEFHVERAWNNATPAVRAGYLKMWVYEDFTSEAKGLKTPFRVVLGS